MRWSSRGSLTTTPSSPAEPRLLALITGASSGIGAAFARGYARRGFDLALVARREDRLREVGSALAAEHGIQAYVIAADLSAWEAHVGVTKALAGHGRQADVLVNNAGFSIAQSFAGVAWERQRDFLMTLVVNACGLAYDVIPGMVERGGGAIVNVASLAGFAPGAAGHSLYPAAKSLAIKFSQSLSEELSGKGIKVTAVCPGFTLTEFAKANGTQGVMDGAPRRLFQTAEQVAESAIEANKRGRVVFVPGLHNKLAAALLHYLPGPVLSAIIRKGSARSHLGD
ncbi:MAG TPA: SDR family NAD(P)-dependent oxidoreductase [Caulobacteraceae bacterium]|nr:SDR family NAD(P)-dependent oxidoreductase [Caulobacteraceae bacterium]